MSGNKSEWRNWGSHLFIAIIGVVAGVVGTIAFIAGKDSPRSTPEEKQEISTSIPSPTTKPSIRAPNKKGATCYGVPPSPADVETPILSEKDLFTLGYGRESGCYPEGNTHTVIVVKAGQDDFRTAEQEPFYFMADEKCIQGKYFIERNLSNAIASWMPSIMVPGRRLKIKYAYCGNGGFQYLTYIKALRSSDQ